MLNLSANALQTKFKEAVVFFQRGELAPAKAIFEALLMTEPNFADALHLLGIIEHQMNNPQRAVELINRAIGIDSTRAAFYFNRGNALHELGQLHAAIDSYDQTIHIQPNVADAYFNRGVVYQELSNWKAALENYNRAIALKSNFAESYFNRGNTLWHLTQLEEAVDSYDTAIRINPNYPGPYFNRGNALHALRRLQAAIESYDQAIAIKPNFANAYIQRGNALQKLKQFENAIKSYDCAISIEPQYAESYVGRAAARQELKQLEVAITDYEKAITIKPDFDYLLGMLFHAKMKCCDWRDFEKNIAELIKRIDHGEKSSTGFPLLSLTTSLSIQRKAAEIWLNDKYPVNDSLGGIPKHLKSEKIRIGYFSADFHAHPTSFLLAELFELHDKNRFEVIAFSFGPDSHDEMRKRLKKTFDEFIDVRHLSDKEAARLVRDKNIDIAINLGGATVNSRTGIFAYRAAPIQVNYLGYPGTMGAEYFDYLIADGTIIPEEAQQYYVEKIVYLPNSYQANDSKRKIAERIFSRKELGLPVDGFIFCCFNNNHKITPDTFNGWMRLLKAVTGSVLFLYADNETAKQNLKKEAQGRGVDSTRLVFGERLTPDEYLARYRIADLFLNTFPFDAGTTASDALWAGLPVLTRIGETFVSRVAASLLTAIDLPELITDSQESYEAMAIELASNPAKLDIIRTKLSANRLTTPLFNTSLFTQHLEEAYTQMIERYQADLSPDHIYVTA